MTTTTYSADLGDGNIETRTSRRPYQFAVVVEITAAEKSRRVALWEISDDSCADAYLAAAQALAVGFRYVAGWSASHKSATARVRREQKAQPGARVWLVDAMES